jgi:hypothetical protein
MTAPGNTWPIIIGGCHRSGTSLIRRILNAHPRIYCGPEVKFFRDFYGDYLVDDPVRHARFLTSARSILPEADVLEILGQAFIALHQRAAAQAGKPRWADKNPENVLYLTQWEKMLGEEWFFIHVVRNPLDTLASIMEADFKYAIPSDLDSRIEFYRSYSEAGLNYCQMHPERSYRMVYERLAASPWEEVERLMQWLGEKAETDQLAFNSFQHQSGLEDPKVGKTQKIHSESIHRWEKFFSTNETAIILGRTGSLWKKLDENHYYPLEQMMK